MRTAQEIFDTVVNHLRKQNTRSVSDTGACMYRDSRGHKCAVGALISDDVYASSMERKVVSALLEHHSLPDDLQQEFTEHLGLLRKLQSIHDFEDISQWESWFVAVAKSFDLTYTPPV